MGLYPKNLPKWQKSNGKILIPYVLNVGPSVDKGILAAMGVWTNTGLVKFQPLFKPPVTGDYLSIEYPEPGTGAYVDGVGRASPRRLYMPAGASVSSGVHELAHVIGLMHEQRRPDRDDYINVYPDRVQDGRYRNYVACPADDCQPWGDFDYKSVTIYSSDSYQGVCYRWTPGWDLAVHWRVPGATTHDLLFMIKSSTGECHVHEIEHSGDLGKKIQSSYIGTGWTIGAIPNSQEAPDGESVLYLVNGTTGAFNSFEVDSNGIMYPDTPLQDKMWTTGWTNIKIWNSEFNMNFVVLMKDTGETHFHPINSTGKISKKRGTYDLSLKEPTIAVSDEGGLFITEPTTGKFYVYKLHANLELVMTKEYSWSTGWTAISIYNQADLITIYKNEVGSVHVHDISSGSIGPRVFEDTWFPNLTYSGITDATQSGTMIAYNPNAWTSKTSRSERSSHYAMLDIDHDGTITQIPAGDSMESKTGHTFASSSKPTDTDIDTVKHIYNLE